MDKLNNIIRKHITLYGWVQGVGFRYRARHSAELYSCTGWVRNEWDGSVTMEIQGTEENIDRVILALHDRSVEHISTNEVVISGGLSDYRPGGDDSFHDVFERADALMYEEKQLLKGMGAISRDDADAARPAFMVDEGADILRLKRAILIVEDEQINRLILGNMLGEGYERLYAADGIEALEQIKLHRDDLAIVLLDLQMPRLSGMEVLKVMKEEKELKDIPVIVLTADQSAEVECLKYGAMDFIPKPYPTAEIVQARVNRCIELSEKRNIIETTERDSLTNLFNLDYFLRYVRMYDQHYTDMRMDAIVLDVNNFHVLNERYGKQYGDSVLARIGARVRQIAREVGGVGCRRGADTFLIYCPHREDYGAVLDKASDGLAGEDVSENRVRLRMGVYAKPVPPEDFDRFLIERMKEKTMVTPEVRKTYMSISKALTSDFESIFYVDMVTDCYLEFYTGKDGKLEIRPGGTDFFGGAREKLLRDVAEEDKELCINY